MVAIFNCQPIDITFNNSTAKEPTTIPPGNQTWNLFNIVVLLSEYISAINGLHAASTEPLAKPIKNDEISNVVNPSA